MQADDKDWSFVYQHYAPENLSSYLYGKKVNNDSNDSNDKDNDLSSVKNLVTICGYLAVFSALLVTMSPIPIMTRVRREKSVGALPLLPFTVMAMNCFSWFTYGTKIFFHFNFH